jgi:hypothetical protein
MNVAGEPTAADLSSQVAELSIRHATNHEFILFPKLPYDIRVLVWHAIIYQDQPRKITLKAFGDLDRSEELLDLLTQPNPITFSVNGESRTQALLKYKPVIRLGEDRKSGLPPLFGRPKQYYYRAEVDTLVLESIQSYAQLNYHLSMSDSRIWREYIRNLQIHEYDSDIMRRHCGGDGLTDPPKGAMGMKLVDQLERFKVLVKLTHVKESPFENRF